VKADGCDLDYAMASGQQSPYVIDDHETYAQLCTPLLKNLLELAIMGRANYKFR